MIQRFSWAAALGVLVLAACKTEKPGASVTAEAPSKIAADFFTWQKEDSLFLRTRLGLPIERLPDVSLARVERDAEKARGLLARLDKIQPNGLDANDALTADTLRFHLQAIADAPRFYWLTPVITPYACPIGGVTQAIADMKVTDRASGEAYLKVLKQVPALVDALRTYAEGQASRGIRAPKDELKLVIPFWRANAQPFARSPYAFKARPSDAPSAENAASIAPEAARVVEREINPAIGRMVTFLEGDYSKQAPAGVGMSQYPGGREYYDWLVRYHTTTNTKAEDIHQMGLRQIERINKEVDGVQAKVAFKGTRDAFKASLKKNPRLFAKTPEEMHARLWAHIERIEPKIDAFFLRRPKASYGIKRLRADLEGSQTFGYYSPTTATEPTGYYYYNASNLKERTLLTGAGLMYHELLPGHHYQFSLATENGALPDFRRQFSITAYTEGWGEYSSMLADEMGMYADPYDKLGRLAMDMFISNRLVVDTGMNALGWSREKAIEFMRANLFESETQIQTETLRYSADIPGQALGYKMGAIKILELREKAHKALGETFDIRRFHDTVVTTGSITLPAMERLVDRFVAEEKAR